MKLLNTIKSYPDFLKIKKAALKQLATEIRDYLINLGKEKSIH